MAKVKILKEGQTDIDSTDIWRFSFHSDYPTFKIATSGSQNITILANQTEAYHDIAHNLGYKPMFLAWFKYSTYPATQIIGEGGGFFDRGILDIYDDPTSIITFSELDNNKLRLKIYSSPYGIKSNTTFTLYWIIFLDEF